MEGQQGNKRQNRKIRLGRLAVDPIFLMLFLFFALSSLFMLVFILSSSR